MRKKLKKLTPREILDEVDRLDEENCNEYVEIGIDEDGGLVVFDGRPSPSIEERQKMLREAGLLEESESLRRKRAKYEGKYFERMDK